MRRDTGCPFPRCPSRTHRGLRRRRVRLRRLARPWRPLLRHLILEPVSRWRPPPRPNQIPFRLGESRAMEADEAHSLQRAEMARREPQHHVPFVECALHLAAVHADARQQVVCIGEMRMPLEPAQRHLERDVELPLLAQRFAQRHEDAAARIARELIAHAAHVFRHRRAPRARAAAASGCPARHERDPPVSRREEDPRGGFARSRAAFGNTPTRESPEKPRGETESRCTSGVIGSAWTARRSSSTASRWRPRLQRALSPRQTRFPLRRCPPRAPRTHSMSASSDRPPASASRASAIAVCESLIASSVR